MTQNTDTQTNDRISLPLPPAVEGREAANEDMAIYARFMRHLRHVPNSRTEIKILSAIQFTADMLGYSDAHVAKLLIDCGLRAPRIAFPAEFLDFADQALLRSGWQVGGPSATLLELKNHWDAIGEDKFAPTINGVKKRYSILDDSVYA